MVKVTVTGLEEIAASIQRFNETLNNLDREAIYKPIQDFVRIAADTQYAKMLDRLPLMSFHYHRGERRHE